MLNTDRYYLRNPDIVAVGTAEHYLFIHGDGSVLELHTPHPAQWSRLLQLLMVPTRGETLCQHLAGPLAIDTRDLLALRHHGVLLEASTPAALETRRHQVFTDNQGYYFARGQQAAEAGITRRQSAACPSATCGTWIPSRRSKASTHVRMP